MKLPQITKDQIFSSRDDDGCDTAFLESFPAMPDPYKDNLMERVINRGTIFAFSELGLIYYLPLIMRFLLENPRVENNPGFLYYRIQDIPQELKAEYPEVFQEWEHTLDRLDEIEEELGPRPSPHYFRPEE